MARGLLPIRVLQHHLSDVDQRVVKQRVLRFQLATSIDRIDAVLVLWIFRAMKWILTEGKIKMFLLTCTRILSFSSLRFLTSSRSSLLLRLS